MSTKRKLPGKLGQPVVRQNAKVAGKGSLDESTTVVSGRGDAARSYLNGARTVVDISSDSSSDGDAVDSDDESDAAHAADDAAAAEGDDVAMEDAEGTAEAPVPQNNEEVDGPTFGDLVRGSASEPVDVAAAFDKPPSQALAYPQSSRVQPPSGASLGTVLAQALKTNDVSLLESCLHTTDVGTIRATIQRLDSPLAGTLLQKLAERLHKRPGRAGTLMVWVQWTLVTHGGYLSTQRDLIKKLAELNRVIEERAKGLQSLLSLKGKLDMLEAQMELRRSMQNQRRRMDDDDADDNVIYVEGQEEDEEEGPRPQRLSKNEVARDDPDEESDISEDMPLTNGIIADTEDEEEESSDANDLLDDEADETAADTGDEDEVDHNDQDSQGEEESDDEAQAAPPTKLQRIGGLFSRKR